MVSLILKTAGLLISNYIFADHNDSFFELPNKLIRIEQSENSKKSVPFFETKQFILPGKYFQFFPLKELDNILMLP